MLKDRIITAIVMVCGLLAALLLLPPLGLMLFFFLIVLAGSWEWADLSGYSGAGRPLYVIVFALLMAATGYFTGVITGSVNTDIVKEVLRAGVLWWSLALLWVMSYPRSAALWRPAPLRALLGFLVLIPAWLAVSYLRGFDNGVWLILFALALVVCADVAAYFSGKAWGKAKLAPAVSPGKSWAGFWGGFVATVALAALLWRLWPGGAPITLLPMLVIAAFTALASVLGDLVESMLKRERGIKDSGSILPGHGGIMDRLDGMAAALPVFALGIILSGWQ